MRCLMQRQDLASGGLPNPVASWADSILLSPRINHLIDFRLVIRGKLAEFAEEGLLQDCVSGFLAFIQQIVGGDLEGLSNPGQFFCRTAFVRRGFPIPKCSSCSSRSIPRACRGSIPSPGGGA